MQIRCHIQRKFIHPSPRIFGREVNSKNTENELRVRKFTAKATASQLLLAEDGLMILLGFISACAIASSFSQILRM
jgi:hypothetical protein